MKYSIGHIKISFDTLPDKQGQITKEPEPSGYLETLVGFLNKYAAKKKGYQESYYTSYEKMLEV